MTTILTDAPLDADHPMEKTFIRPESVGAISADGTFRPRACLDYMFTTLGGLRCGMCIRVCPL